jgi:hypothetical protein
MAGLGLSPTGYGGLLVFVGLPPSKAFAAQVPDRRPLGNWSRTVFEEAWRG